MVYIKPPEKPVYVTQVQAFKMLGTLTVEGVTISEHLGSLIFTPQYTPLLGSSRGIV